jgi:hypothetical protein
MNPLCAACWNCCLVSEINNMCCAIVICASSVKNVYICVLNLITVVTFILNYIIHSICVIAKNTGLIYQEWIWRGSRRMKRRWPIVWFPLWLGTGVWIKKAMSNMSREGFLVIPKIITTTFVTEESNLLTADWQWVGHDDLGVNSFDREIEVCQCERYLCCKWIRVLWLAINLKRFGTLEW